MPSTNFVKFAHDQTQRNRLRYISNLHLEIAGLLIKQDYQKTRQYKLENPLVRGSRVLKLLSHRLMIQHLRQLIANDTH